MIVNTLTVGGFKPGGCKYSYKGGAIVSVFVVYSGPYSLEEELFD